MKTISLALLGLLVGAPTSAQTPPPQPNPERSSPTAAPQDLPKLSSSETVRYEDHPKSELNGVAWSACDDHQMKK